MKWKTKSLIMSTTLALTSLPFVTISCSSTQNSVTNYKILPTYASQADQLIALGIKPDYYPLQFGQNSIDDYILKAGKFMTLQSDEFKSKFQKALNRLIPDTRGIGWWNQEALDSAPEWYDHSYWSQKFGDVVLYEQYLIDDGPKSLNTSSAPKHYNNTRTFLKTNFRVSRDPFTRVPRQIIDAINDVSFYQQSSLEVQKIAHKLLEVARHVESLAPGLAPDGGSNLSGIIKQNPSEGELWLYNDYVFARDCYNYLLTRDLINSPFYDWILNKDGIDEGLKDNYVFGTDKESDDLIANLFFKSTFKDEEKAIGFSEYTQNLYEKSGLRMNTPAISSASQAHHAIYEIISEIGGAPTFEGSQRDGMLYFFNTASLIEQAFSLPSQYDTSDNWDGYNHLEEVFRESDPDLWNNLTTAKERAINILTDLRTRLSYFKNIVELIKSKNGGKLVFGITTLDPAMRSTIQTISKYSFLYEDIGFDQPIPTNLSEESNKPVARPDDLFSIDDNGWWWNLGEMAQPTSTVAERMSKFEGQFDLGVVVSNNAQFKNLKTNDRDLIASTFKSLNKNHHIDSSFLEDYKVDYQLWTEGVKTPFAVHMILDQVLDQIIKKYGDIISDVDKNGALEWGKYFMTDFISE